MIANGVNLSGADLKGLTVEGSVSFAGINFTGADLSNADLRNVNNFNSTILDNANLTDAMFPSHSLNNVTGSGIIGSPIFSSSDYKVINGYFVGYGVTTTNANLSNLDLSGINFSYSNLDNTDFSNSILDSFYHSIIGEPSSLPSENWIFNQGFLIPSAFYLDINSTNPTAPYDSLEKAHTNLVKLNEWIDSVNANIGLSNRGPVIKINFGEYILPSSIGTQCSIEGLSQRENVIINGVGQGSLSYRMNNDYGGIFNLTLTDCWNGGFSGPSLSWGTVVSNCVVKNCYNGPGVQNAYIYNSIIKNNNNYTGKGGGARDCILFNSIIKNNSAREGGALYNSIYSNVGFYNCVIIDNLASEDYDVLNSGKIYNSIIYYSDQYPLNEPSLSDYSRIDIRNSCSAYVNNGLFGNITNNPVFVDFDNGNYRLQTNSPCIDTGLKYLDRMEIDADGNTRVIGTQIDMGAYEYQYSSMIDSDGDGLFDEYEFQNGLNPFLVDTDSDGFDDGFEIELGMNPLLSNDNILEYITNRPSIFDINSGGMTMDEAQAAMRDLRVGSKTFSVDNGSARVRMYVDESRNLTDWTNTPHVLELDIPADTDTKFFRFRMD